MASILVLVGSIFGFASAVASLVMFDASILVALAIWSGLSLCLTMAGLANAMMANATVAIHAEPEIA